ncbi:MAG: hypothetical protein LBL83_03370, partial [Clostridiales bacterium]|nr:hypothetical protein [Clostridiales bacterium]
MKKRASAAKERAPAWRAGAPAGLKEPPARLGPLSRWLRPLRPLCVFMALLVAALAQLQAFAVPEAVLRAAGNYPKAKTEQTVKSEKELAKLAEYETRIKASIKDAEISRTKLLAQKRAELKQIRKVRDDAAKKELEEIKGRKT